MSFAPLTPPLRIEVTEAGVTGSCTLGLAYRTGSGRQALTSWYQVSIIMISVLFPAMPGNAGRSPRRRSWAFQSQ
jgi:hypothetical protein